MSRREDKRSNLLQAARDVFARFGLKKTTLEDIAEKAGVSRASIYYYFKSKEDIFSAVVHHESDALLNEISREVDRAGSAKEKLIAFVRSRYLHLQKLTTLHAITQDIVEELLPLAETERKQFFERELRLLGGILRMGNEEGTFFVEDVELFALAAISALRGLEPTFLAYGKYDRIEEGLDGLLNVILRGLELR